MTGIVLSGAESAVDRMRPPEFDDSHSTTPNPSSSSAHHSPFEALQNAGVDTANLPIDFLNSYPYPAFVLISAAPDANHFPPPTWARTKFSFLKPLEPVWANREWKRLACSSALLDGLSVEEARRLAIWLGSSQPEREKAEVDLDDPGGSHDDAVAAPSAEASLTLTFAFGEKRVALLLSKTHLSLYQLVGGQRSLSPAHVYAVVTATPLNSPTVPDRSDRGLSTMSRATTAAADGDPPPPPPRGRPREASREEERRGPRKDDVYANNDGDDAVRANHWDPARPLYVFRDGSVVHGPLPDRTEQGKVSDVVALLESTDWSATPLGRRESWSSSLHNSVNTAMACPLPVAVWWGKEFTLIYNQLYADKIYDHPEAFGRSGPQSWAELWRYLGSLSDVVLTGTTVLKEDELFLEKTRHCPRLREAYYSQLWAPLKDATGEYAGLYFTLHDTTLRVLAERRTTVLRDLAERAYTARSIKEFNETLLDTLEANPRDAPFALIFHVESTTSNIQPRSVGSRANSLRGPPTSTARLRYGGGVGVPDGHVSAPQTCTVELLPGEQPTSEMMASAFTTLEISPSEAGQPASKPNYTPMRRGIFRSDATHESSSVKIEPAPADEWPLAEALRARRPIIVRDCSRIIKGYSVRVWEELPTSAIVIPITSADGGLPRAVLVLGLSSCLSFDIEYQAFLRLRLQLSINLAAARYYQEEAKRMEELAELERAKKLLFANVSHELVTPLSLVAGPLDDVVAELPAGRLRDGLKMARRNVQRLSRLVGMLMDLSSLEAGHMASSFRHVNLGEVTRNVAAMFKQAADAARLNYVVDCDMENREVYLDRDKYEKILFTLIGNALRFTRKGTIRVTVNYEDGTAIVAVADTGVGIPAKSLAFGDKYPTDDTAIHTHGGSGITLLFTRKLVELHQGTFNVDSCTAEESPDGSHGTRFTVTFPLGYEHLPPGAVETPHSSAGTPLQQFHQSVLDAMSRAHWGWTSIPKEDLFHSPSSAASSPSDRNARGIDPSTVYFDSTDVVLLVDSLPDTRRYMRAIFAPFCKVIEASDGHEALEKVKEHHPNLVIADVMLPKISGFELLTELRRGTPEQQMVPIILLTSMEDARADGAFGADDYMPKPFNARELIARAHMQLQLGKKRRALESAFDLRTNELRLLTEYSPVGIFRCSEDGYVHYANQKWHEISGYPQTQPITNWGDYVQEDHQEHVSQIWRQYIGKQAVHETAEYQWKNGRWCATTVIRVNRDDAPAHIIGCTVDITERKTNERMQREQVLEAEQRRAAAEEARRQQELLIDITSHEIRNPISSLMQCASLVKSNLLALQEQMQRAVDDETVFHPTDQLLVTMGEDLEALDSIYQCGLTQERISNDVLSLGKIQLDMLQMYDTETNICKEAQKAIFVFQNEARMKRLDLSLNIGPGFERLGVERIMTDPVRLGQVVTNLLSNAIRFTSNSPVRRVELRVDLGVDPPVDGCAMPPPSDRKISEDTQLYLFVSVVDTGPGLTPSELEVLFQRFRQASPETHTVYGGSGLGLFVCRKLTERMGGHIDVVSEHGRGSEFRFYIRTRPCLTTQAPEPENASNEIAGPFKPHILIVEDNLINRTVLMRQLQHVGLTVESASNGLEALERLRASQRWSRRTNGASPSLPAPHASPVHSSALGKGKGKARDKGHRRAISAAAHTVNEAAPKRFDCVLMDLEMPVMDGYTSVRLLRADEAAGLLAPTNVVALTGNARQAQVPEAMADFTDVVVKPYRLDDLLRTIDDSIRTHAGEPRSSGESARSWISGASADADTAQHISRIITPQAQSV
ncbi:uncharacterized protein COLE_00307 [Cutaneotrichosporon oleaginosum]|uniref:uncharacterized protein n=1 Tax=Cutaneotrichosporon oleaginosum TaxID=879819 RepID=UPI0013247EA0|nr:hypothetical protein COLE_00307 [Cutaneotrichosporon oleaginosum]